VVVSHGTARPSRQTDGAARLSWSGGAPGIAGDQKLGMESFVASGPGKAKFAGK
jgi:hypothetical protein